MKFTTAYANISILLSITVLLYSMNVKHEAIGPALRNAFIAKCRAFYVVPAIELDTEQRKRYLLKAYDYNFVSSF